MVGITVLSLYCRWPGLLSTVVWILGRSGTADRSEPSSGEITKLAQLTMDDDINPEEYVEENRKEILRIIQSTDDSFMRACAWALLDKYSSNEGIDALHEELDAVAEQRENE